MVRAVGVTIASTVALVMLRLQFVASNDGFWLAGRHEHPVGIHAWQHFNLARGGITPIITVIVNEVVHLNARTHRHTDTQTRTHRHTDTHNT